MSEVSHNSSLKNYLLSDPSQPDNVSLNKLDKVSLNKLRKTAEELLKNQNLSTDQKVFIHDKLGEAIHQKTIQRLKANNKVLGILRNTAFLSPIFNRSINKVKNLQAEIIADPQVKQKMTIQNIKDFIENSATNKPQDSEILEYFKDESIPDPKFKEEFDAFFNLLIKNVNENQLRNLLNGLDLSDSPRAASLNLLMKARDLEAKMKNGEDIKEDLTKLLQDADKYFLIKSENPEAYSYISNLVNKTGIGKEVLQGLMR